MNIDEILQEHEEYIKGVTRKWCGNLAIYDKQDREDCLQEVYIGLLDNIPKYKEELNNKFTSYLYTIIKSRVSNFKRNYNRNNIPTIEYDDEISQQIKDVDYTMQIMDKLNELEKEELELYYLYFKQGYTQQEIAKMKGCSRQLITKNIAVILGKLKVDK
jgi:RNA polymerase sigma factor (sigma-70 family)